MAKSKKKTGGFEKPLVWTVSIQHITAEDAHLLVDAELDGLSVYNATNHSGGRKWVIHRYPKSVDPSPVDPRLSKYLRAIIRDFQIEAEKREDAVCFILIDPDAPNNPNYPIPEE